MFNIDKEFNKLVEELDLPKEEIDTIIKEDKYKNEIVKIEDYLQYMRDKILWYKNDKEINHVLNSRLEYSGWTKQLIRYECRCNSKIKISYFEEINHYNEFDNSPYNSYTTEYICNSIWCPKCGERINFGSSGRIKIIEIKIDLMEGEYGIK